jgi:hypothetical protein
MVRFITRRAESACTFFCVFSFVFRESALLYKPHIAFDDDDDDDDDVFFFPDFPHFQPHHHPFINSFLSLSLFKNKVEHVRVRGRDHRRRFSRGENGQ